MSTCLRDVFQNRLGMAILLIVSVMNASAVFAEFQVGAAIVDVSPEQFPAIINGGMTSRQAEEVTGPISARAIVISDGQEEIAIVVVDSCMLPRPLLDDTKLLAQKKTGISIDKMLISATHTHTAPAAMSCLGTDLDTNYIGLLRERIARSIEQAQQKLQPARIAWGKTTAADFTAVRRWAFRTDRVQNDPFGNPTVRANMHAAQNWDNVTGPTGPEDPDLSMISFQSLQGETIAVLCNFSMHYFSGVKPVNPDYFGPFCESFQQRIDPDKAHQTKPVVVMSHGCSGDIWRRDYQLPPEQRNDTISLEQYTQELLDVAYGCYEKLDYQSASDIEMAEQRFELKYRTPNVQLLEWSQKVVAEMGDRLPKTTPEVYAREQIILHERQSTEVVVQAVRIGDLCIATTPNETYALTGMKVKLQSPAAKTMVIELANGGDGYIPPPEQHYLGGYNTWAARSAGLEVQAEPKIVQALLKLLEHVTGNTRKPYQQPQGSLVRETLALQPIAYYRLDELAGSRAVDLTANHADGVYEAGMSFFLEGPTGPGFSETEINRAVHFSGARINSRLPKLKDRYTISLWVWNGFPAEGREVCGWLFSRGGDFDAPESSEQLGIQGTTGQPGRLCFQCGPDGSAEHLLAGNTFIERWTWNHVLLTRDGDQVSVYLNGNSEPEIQGKLPVLNSVSPDQIFLAGRPDRTHGFEGKLDEIAIFDRVLTEQERLSISPAVADSE